MISDESEVVPQNRTGHDQVVNKRSGPESPGSASIIHDMTPNINKEKLRK